MRVVDGKDSGGASPYLWLSVDQDHETLNKSIFNGWNFDQKHKRLDILLVKGGAALTQILITVKSKACYN